MANWVRLGSAQSKVELDEDDRDDRGDEVTQCADARTGSDNLLG